MRYETLGERGGANASQLRPYLNHQSQQHHDNSRYAPQAQLPPGSHRLQRINARAAEIARDEALRDAKRALKACRPDEVAELRQSSAMLFALATSLTSGGAR